MKTIIRWSVTLGLMVSPLLPNRLITPPPVVALSQSEIVELLGGIPVFSLLNDQGSPLSRQLDNNDIVVPVFMSRTDAQELLLQLQQDNPDLANLYQVQVLPLGRIYETARENSTDNQRLLLEYIPTVTEIEAAKQIADNNGEEFPGGVPLYMARLKSDQSYLTIRKDNKQFVPVFFEQATIQKWVETVQQSQPEIASQVYIQIVSLSDLIANLEQKDNDLLKNLRFWPSEEMMKIIRANLQNQQNQPAQP